MKYVLLMEKILYIGSGLDFNPLIHFNQVKEYVFVDTLPRSEFDGYIYNNSLFYDEFYKPLFVNSLLKEINKYGFKLVEKIQLDNNYHLQILTLEQKKFWGIDFKNKFPDINPCLMIFKNVDTCQIFKYYISTNILTNMCLRLQNDIYQSTRLIICGFHPNKIILEYISKPIKLYCYTSTCYYLDDNDVDDFDNLIYWTFNNTDKVKVFFNQLFVCDKTNGNLIECVDMKHVEKITKQLNLT